MVLAFLGVVVTLLILVMRLQESGIDLGWLNPFSWHRRRKFRKEHDLNPAFKLDSPMDVAALFMIAVAKVDGELSKEQKARILSLFQSEFKLNTNEASALLRSSAHLLELTDEVFVKPNKVIERSFDKFGPEQVKSVCFLIDEVALVEGNDSSAQNTLINKIKKALPSSENAKW